VNANTTPVAETGISGTVAKTDLVVTSCTGAANVLAGGKCYCAKGSHLIDDKCIANNQRCDTKDYSATLQSCNSCSFWDWKEMYKNSDGTNSDYCEAWSWWVWMLWILFFLVVLGALGALIWWLATKFCCKKKVKKTVNPPPTVENHNVNVQAAKPRQEPRVVVDYQPMTVSYSQPVYHEMSPVREEHERVLVETRRWSPGREMQVEYHNDVDWARQSRTKFEAQQVHEGRSNVVIHDPTPNYVPAGNTVYERPVHTSYTTGNVVERPAHTSYTTGHVAERPVATSYTNGNVVRVSHQGHPTGSYTTGERRVVAADKYNPFNASN
jgi:hypothetical protein